MKITRLGHAAALIEGSKTVIIDPFITGSPAATLSFEEVPHVDFIAVTHDHDDHFGDAIALAKRDGAVIIGIHENTIRSDVASQDIKSEGGNIGGRIAVDDVTFSFTPAVHSSNHGDPCGFVVEMDGRRVYHAGDTGLFSDMKLIPELFGKLHVALLPIGGRYTMDEKAAAKAIALLRPEVVIPMHYDTWPIIAADTEKFKRLVKNAVVKVVKPGETFTFGH